MCVVLIGAPEVSHHELGRDHIGKLAEIIAIAWTYTAVTGGLARSFPAAWQAARRGLNASSQTVTKPRSSAGCSSSSAISSHENRADTGLTIGGARPPD
jgi:hypothetical protein